MPWLRDKMHQKGENLAARSSTASSAEKLLNWQLQPELCVFFHWKLTEERQPLDTKFLAQFLFHLFHLFIYFLSFFVFNCIFTGSWCVELGPEETQTHSVSLFYMERMTIISLSKSTLLLLCLTARKPVGPRKFTVPISEITW